MRVIATHEATLRRDWLCRHCSNWGHATVRARGQADKRVWLSRARAADRAHELAEEALERDAERIRGLIACPACQRRAPGAVGWSIVRVAPMMALCLVLATAVAGVCAVEWSHGMWTTPVFLVIAVAVASHTERRRWRQARDARLEVNTRPAPRPTAPRQVAEPVAGGPFRTASATPVVPVVTARVDPATPIVPGDPADKPRFLV
jgi:hypothetical protein